MSTFILAELVNIIFVYFDVMFVYCSSRAMLLVFTILFVSIGEHQMYMINSVLFFTEIMSISISKFE